MKESVFKSYDELPLFLSAETVAKLLGISISSTYELMQQNDFPVLRIGNRKGKMNCDVVIAVAVGGLLLRNDTEKCEWNVNYGA